MSTDEEVRAAVERLRMHRAYRFWLEATPAQRQILSETVGACRFVYNLALEQRRDWWRQYRRNTGRNLSYFSQSAELTALRAQVDWLGAVPRSPLDRALSDLDDAFRAFFAGRADFPGFRTRLTARSFAHRAVEGVHVEKLNAKWARVRIGRLGWFRFRLTRPIVGDLKMVYVREEAAHWYVSLSCKVEAPTIALPAAQVGIDRGVANTLALSTGELLRLPAAIEAVERRRRKAQRVLARRRKGSARRGKQKACVATLHARARRMRTDWLHRVSTDIVRRHALVAVEALNIENMTAGGRGKRGLNRSILAQGWGQFERMLAYKLEATGGALIRVPAAYTSQTCTVCGAVDARSRESQAVFRCVHCGHADHADTNAAKEVLRRSTSELLVEGARWRPGEARTTGEAA